MKSISILEIMAALGAGCVGGVFFAFSSFVMSALAKLEDPSGLNAMKQINQSVLGSSFLAVLFGTAVLMLALLYFEPSLKGASGKCIVAACLIYIFGSLGVTMLANVPMNVRLQGVGPGDMLSWKSYIRDWTRWNSVRGLAATTSSALLLLSIMFRK